MPTPRTAARLPLLALALLAAGCSGGPFDASGAEAELRAARARWEAGGAADYAYTVRRTCFCGPDVVEPVRVEVRGGRTVSVSAVEGRTPAPGAFDRLDTVEEMFASVQDAIDADPYLLDARYDPARGHPVSVAVDYERRAVDDEGGFAVSDFVVLR
jgi:hypothetical protein